MVVCWFIFNLKNCWDIFYLRGWDNKWFGYNLIEGDMYIFFKINLFIDKFNNMNLIKSIFNLYDNIWRKF